ncbi:MAG: ABC transporter permease, partial [Mucilaginibacter polytrichastri]|nr:ABC transporter permease [Mucilaginibacter polytrichastri]
PLSAAPEKYQHIIALNPMTPVIETFRLGFLGTGMVNPQSMTICIISTLVIFTCGLITFNKVEKDFVDTI